MTKSTSLGVCIFAYNEEENIEKCLQSVINSTAVPERLEIKVLVNGTTDKTSEIVKTFSIRYPQVKLVELKLGDKSNAWNEYVYSDINPDCNHFFIDGDNWLPAYALDFIEHNWDLSSCWGVACLPIGVSESLRKFLQDYQLISGNCYGVSSDFIHKIREKNFKIPIGFIGDDSVISYLLQEWVTSSNKQGKVQVISLTGPVIPRVKISVGNIKMLHNRYKRYGVRHLQQEIFYLLGRKNNLEQLPPHSVDMKSFLFQIEFKQFFAVSPIQMLYMPYSVLHIWLTNK
ncbi:MULTISPECIES: glycosyltransferase family 2 protein [unclassified Colwellia]|uniref:glycosyltransferase n=1 Tax=unclassified Colwellia TaxID=196834 RepID=UPI0015F71F1F|nr:MULTISPECIES: glycosyltransferase family A protein [unclassified Colwellia]MBA6357437.1 glycosyltransferase family 2 protein [Colwellia sp. BRX8-3]MBA6361621.1 glycosyltransferase family 2 protein [Colwellia sp. BRX8-6]MBA6369142.1 glycosyltransferase family 2 protein [Colwellia sp. BRX8-5]MBA6374911.1 glycosyltransferase family 2 protein [Colwellia sp. BRX8-2]